MEKQQLQDLVEIWGKNVCYSPQKIPKDVFLNYSKI